MQGGLELDGLGVAARPAVEELDLRDLYPVVLEHASEMRIAMARGLQGYVLL